MSTSASVAPEPTPRPPGERMHPWIVFGLVLLVLLWRAPSLGFLLANPDHGYQLSLGRQILLGAFPYVDLMFHYGPLVAFTSAFNLGFLGGVMGETLVCALGYADGRHPGDGWREGREPLAEWFAAMMARPSFAETAPVF